jgi:6-phosphogluconolactonase
MKIYLVLSLVLAVTMLAKTGLAADQPATYLIYVGTSGGAKSKGIYAGRMDARTGALSPFSLAAESPNPSFVTIHANNRFLYAVNAISNFRGKNSGSVSAFAIDRATGKLTPLNQQSSGGAGPCHLVVDHTGKHVLAANYGGGSVCVLPIKEDGSLGEATTFIQHQGSSVNPKRQDGPHAHGIYLDAGNRFAFVPDLGMDKVMIYKFDAAKGLLTANDPAFATIKPGSGPRHLAFHPSERFAYVISELSSTLTAFACDTKRGVLKELQTVSTLPEDFKGESTTAEVEVHPSGKFAYGSNRGHDSIAVFTIDQKTGRLTFVERTATQGKIPRNFGIDPTGKFLVAANQATDNLVVFRVDAKTGQLTPTGSAVESPAPICVKFVPAAE